MFPLLPRFVLELLGFAALLKPDRFVPAVPVLAGRAPVFALPRLAPATPILLVPDPLFELARFVEGVLRLIALGCCLVLDPCCCRAFACRVDMESPRVVPPY